MIVFQMTKHLSVPGISPPGQVETFIFSIGFDLLKYSNKIKFKTKETPKVRIIH